ncbi:MAG: energy-coupling factor transporter ATPase [bacterium]
MAIEFRQVGYSYSKNKNNIDKAIYNINLSIEGKNEFVGILGHTGSGKSTLMQHINGLILPTNGEVVVFDNIITNKKRKNPKMKSIRKQIGFVFQFPEYQLFEETVLKDIMFGPMNFGFTEEEAKESAIKYAKLLNIEHILDKSPFELSGGQMRKVAIAGVLAYEPDILLLDEPTRGLDPKGAKDIMDFFNYMNKEYNKTIIMITHDMDLAYEHVNRLVVLKEGKIEFDGNKEDLFISEIYKDLHLKKPLILDSIDELNNNLNLNLNYNIKTIEELVEKLRGDI